LESNQSAIDCPVAETNSVSVLDHVGNDVYREGLHGCCHNSGEVVREKARETLQMGANEGRHRAGKLFLPNGPRSSPHVQRKRGSYYIILFFYHFQQFLSCTTLLTTLSLILVHFPCF